MKIAFASQDLTRIDAHLGWARYLSFYDISAEGHRFLSMRDFGVLSQDGSAAKLEPKMRALRGCVLVFVTDLGVAAEARLLRQNTHPVRSFARRSIAEALEELHLMLRCRPSPWLRQRLQEERRRGAAAPL